MRAAGINFSRHWAMPSPDTFSIKPIGVLVGRYIRSSKVSIDPFARNSTTATYRNDISAETAAQYHLDAREFLKLMIREGVKADLVLFDPPYSPRQITEVYKRAGLEVGMKETQTARLYSECRDLIFHALQDGAIVISCGWNTVGMGINRRCELIEIMLVCHGGAHNDTIVIVEKFNGDLFTNGE